jgi:hypothetical protein
LTTELVVELVKRCEDFRARWRERQGVRGTTAERFARWWAFDEPLLRAAIDAGLAVAQSGLPPRDALEALAEIERDGDILGLLRGSVYDGLSYIGYDEGYFYGGQDWGKLCVFCSGIAFLAELCGVPRGLDEEEETMEGYGADMYKEVAPPPGMPRHHWWWFGPSRAH